MKRHLFHGNSPARIVAVLLLAVLGGCSTVSSMFGSLFGASAPKPSPLQAFTPERTLSVAWQQRLDGVQFPLVVAVNRGIDGSGDRVTVAGNDGSVLALDAATGRELWRANAGGKLSAGVGSDGRFAAVVTRDNELVLLDAGRALWRERLASRVAGPPLVAGERVFAMGVDRAVHAFDALDGRRLWTLQRPGDALTLSQPGVVAAFKDTLLVGQGPRLVGLDPVDGMPRWEAAVAAPRGTNEVERLADLLGPPGRAGDMVCARAFQAAVGCVDAERGTLRWSKVVGGSQAVAVDDAFVVGADASDRISAWRLASGDVAWTTDRFLHRRFAAPAFVGNAVAFGDGEGIVHLLSRTDGHTLARIATDGSAVTALAPVGTTLLVVTRSGGVHALRVG